MPSQKLVRYAEIARNSTRKVGPVGTQEGFAAPSGTLDEKICALIPDFQTSPRKVAERSDDGFMAAVPSLLWWAVVLIVFVLAR